MDAAIDGVKARLKALSGDKGSVARDADQNGEDQNGGAHGKTPEGESVGDSTINAGEGTGQEEGKSPNTTEHDAQTHCGQCGVEFGSKTAKKKSKTKEVQCSFCKVWQCGACTGFKVADLAIINRDDVFYACTKCQGAVSNVVIGNILKTMRSDVDVNERVSKVEEKVDKLLAVESKLDALLKNLPNADTELSGLSTMETKIDSLIEKLPSNDLKKIQESLDQTKANVESVSSEINNKVTEIKSMYSAAVGDNPNATVTYSPEQTQEWITKTSKKVAREIKLEEKKSESRQNNIVILGAQEKDIPDRTQRNTEDKALLEELFAKLEITDVPEKFHRVGAYSNKNEQSQNNEGSPSGSKQTAGRPIKVTFKSPEIVKLIMDNANKLASAPQHLKNLSIGYDLSVEERKVLKDKLNEAKDKNAKNPNFIHKVKGPPWNLQIIRFRKRDRTAEGPK